MLPTWKLYHYMLVEKLLYYWYHCVRLNKQTHTLTLPEVADPPPCTVVWWEQGGVKIFRNDDVEGVDDSNTNLCYLISRTQVLKSHYNYTLQHIKPLSAEWIRERRGLCPT